MRKYKKIIINGRFLVHRTTGVERFAREITERLDRLVKPGKVVLAIPPEVADRDVPKYENIKTMKTGKLHNIAWEHISLPLFALREGGIALNLCNTAPLLSPGIAAIHDVKVLARPQDFSKKFELWYRLLFRNEAERCSCILTVSQFSKREISKYLGVPLKRIVVIPNSSEHYEKIAFDEGALEKYGLRAGGYYFSMSSLEPNKNFRWIAEAARQNPDKVFAAAGSLNGDVFQNGLGFSCPPNMKLLGYVSDEEAKELSRNCAAFLFPTFYEGFGIPPLEAISAGAARIVVSDSEVMHEVYGDCANYIDPHQYEIDLSAPDPFPVTCTGERRDALLHRFTWRRSARKLYALLQRCCDV